MNWKRGFFRMWLVLSIVWVGGAGLGWHVELDRTSRLQAGAAAVAPQYDPLPEGFTTAPPPPRPQLSFDDLIPPKPASASPAPPAAAFTWGARRRL